MGKVLSVEFDVEVDARRGDEVNIDFLAPWDARRKLFDVLEDMELEKTKLRVNVGKLASWETKAFCNKKRGDKTVLFFVLRVADTFRKFKLPADVRRGDKLEITINSIK